MENKKKPSQLVLVPHHHCLGQPNENAEVLFKPEMLTWPIKNLNNEIFDEEENMIFRGAFAGLIEIGPFEAKVSMGVDVENKFLIHPKRVWGKIYLYDQSIVTFSHDSRVENRPFSSLMQWPELKSLLSKNEEEHRKEWIEITSKLSKWGPTFWKKFFEGRIRQRAEELIEKANTKRSDAQELEKSATKILSCFE